LTGREARRGEERAIEEVASGDRLVEAEAIVAIIPASLLAVSMVVRK